MNSVSFFLVCLCLAGISDCQLTVSSGNISLANNDVVAVVAGQALNFSCFTEIQGATINLQTSPANLLSLVNEFGSDSMRQYSLPDVQQSNSNAEFSCRDGVEVISFTLNVQFVTIVNLTNGAGAVGDDVNITFSVEANPQVVVPGGITVDPSKHTDILNDSSLITIVYEYLGRDDDGSYTLTVGNSIVNAMATFTLDVFFGPIFTDQERNISLFVGSRLVINCSIADSNPPVTSIRVTDGGNLNRDITSERYFAIQSVTLNENGTTYTCTAENGETSNSVMFTVTVTELAPSTPTDTSSPTFSSSMTPTIGESTDNSFPVGGIIGIVIGALLMIIGVGIIITVVGYFVWKNKSADKA